MDLELPITFDHLTEKEIARRLERAFISEKKYNPEASTYSELLSGSPKPAAVLIPFLKDASKWNLLFTRRNANLPEHSGQVAFPGGQVEISDASPEQTALREASEEIGLNPTEVRILGKMHDFLTITNYFVTPVVGVIPWPYPIRVASEEVSRVFTIPLTWLADPANHEVQQRSLLTPHKPVKVIYFHPYDGELLWGLSARLTLNLIEILK
jgi:8-oxo-dGTP pyrophosphatase MutT (NUDIX family)